MFKTICIVIPNQAYLEQAGARIRYKRLIKNYEDNGFLLCFSEINDCLKDACDSHDVYLISKCYSSSAVVLAHLAKDAGKIVGVDLFDDYFSQLYDARFVRLRNWLTNLSKICDFAWCSTENMKAVANIYFDESSVHVLNDPVDIDEFSEAESILKKKRDDFLGNNLLKVVWFGMGDNPDFKVGLQDLFAFQEQILTLQKNTFRLHLTVLTNLRALTPCSLENLKKLGDCLNVEIWSEEREKEILRDAHLCFLPVNYQSFSTVKSLNRCVTAFTYGCQVLSTGFNLYKGLDDYLYRNVDDFVIDLNRGHLKLNIDELDAFRETLLLKADPVTEAKNASSFLTNLASARSDLNEELVSPTSLQDHEEISESTPLKSFVYGSSIPIDQIAVMQKTHYIMIGSPFSVTKVRPHFRFDYDVKTGLLKLLVRIDFRSQFEELSDKDLTFLKDEIVGKTKYTQVSLSEIQEYFEESSVWRVSDIKKKLLEPSFILLHYKDVMELIYKVLNFFVDIDMFLLEESKLPWRQPDFQNRETI